MGSIKVRFEVRTPDGATSRGDIRSRDVAVHYAKPLAPCTVVRVETDGKVTRERVEEVLR